jgi:hypothetical protein
MLRDMFAVLEAEGRFHSPTEADGRREWQAAQTPAKNENCDISLYELRFGFEDGDMKMFVMQGSDAITPSATCRREANDAWARDGIL